MSFLLLALLNVPPDDAWAEFRGPAGAGHSTSTGLPKEWSETKNVMWKTPLHGRGWSSPVVWGSQVWLTTGTPDGAALSVLCVDRESGKILVDQKLFQPEKPNDLWKKYNSYASPTPVIEEGRVYVHFGTYGTACLDTKTGKPVWARTDLACDHWRGAGSSPILHDNLVILTFDGHDVQYVVALDKKTGKNVWKTPRAHDFGTDDGDRKKGYSTPIVIEVGGQAQIISPASAATVALDPKTGQPIWWVKHKGHSPAMRSLYGNGLVYFGVGAGNELVAVKPDGKGDVTASHIAWKAGKGIGHKPSPLLVDDLIYVVADNGVASCFDAKTGASVWTQRLGGAYSASPLYADGVIWFFAEDGSATIAKPGREYKEVAKNKLDGGAESKSTPAIAGKALFIRTESALYRVEAK
ncbi:MAG TPA: PQQ-binding-like beta-propeller repeat protein [Planctomycetota bacterium]